jgi:hypothetical protein
MSALESCIDDCLNCHVICLSQATGRSLIKGGRYAEADHVTLMLDCAEICQTAANFLARGSERYRQVCLQCAEICRACAASCQDVGGMQECVEACWRCASTCEEVADEVTNHPRGEVE